MRIAIIHFPGSPQGPELIEALARAEMEALTSSWDEPLDKLASAEAYIIISGLATSQDLKEQAAFSSLLSFLRTQTAAGRPLLGLGLGAVILVETGLVPGLFINRIAIHLAENPNSDSFSKDENGQNSAKVHLRLSEDYQYNAFTRCLAPDQLLPMALTSPQGRFIIPPGLLAEIETQGLNVFSYCDAEGQMSADLKTDPTGSIHNIAALSNKAGNVMAMVPHPDTTACAALFKSLHDHLASGYIEQVEPLYYWPR